MYIYIYLILRRANCKPVSYCIVTLSKYFSNKKKNKKKNNKFLLVSNPDNVFIWQK